MPPREDAGELLQALIEHPGWRLFAECVRAEWIERERIGRREVLSDDGNNDRLINKLRQITAAQEAVEWAVQWPKGEIERIKRQEPTAVTLGPSRRGLL